MNWIAFLWTLGVITWIGQLLLMLHAYISSWFPLSLHRKIALIVWLVCNCISIAVFMGLAG